MRWLLLLIIVLFAVSCVATLGMLVTVTLGYTIVTGDQLFASIITTVVLWAAGSITASAM